jgi:hypothetical protein
MIVGRLVSAEERAAELRSRTARSVGVAGPGEGVCEVVVPGVILIRKKILKRLGTCAFGWVFCRCRWLGWSQAANSRRPESADQKAQTRKRGAEG